MLIPWYRCKYRNTVAFDEWNFPMDLCFVLARTLNVNRDTRTPYVSAAAVAAETASTVASKKSVSGGGGIGGGGGRWLHRTGSGGRGYVPLCTDGEGDPAQRMLIDHLTATLTPEP
jgi:hypothetical protein